MGNGHQIEHPKQIGRYEIVAPIARGGMAEVFLARARGEGGFQRLVTLKRILPHLAETEEFVAMFADEARILAELHHSNIGQVFEFGREGDAYFIAMEYIQGVDLRTIYRHFGKLGSLPPHAMAAFLAADVCGALQYAHSRRDSRGESLGIVHRDVSPSNVLVSFEGEVKLIDFGIARATQRLHETSGSSLKGKFSYMSPEQARGKALDRRSDIFGCGIVLYELLTGSNPFRGSSDMGTLERVRTAHVTPPSSKTAQVPPELEQICLRALAQAPEDRFPEAGEMQAELERFCFDAAYGRRQLAEWMQASFAEQMEHTRRFMGQPPGPGGTRGPGGSRGPGGTLVDAPPEQASEASADVTSTTVFDGWMDGNSGAPPGGPQEIDMGPTVTDSTASHAAGERASTQAPLQQSTGRRLLPMAAAAAATLALALTMFWLGSREAAPPVRSPAQPAPEQPPPKPAAVAAPLAPASDDAGVDGPGATSAAPDLAPDRATPGARPAKRTRPAPAGRKRTPRKPRRAAPEPPPEAPRPHKPPNPEDVEW